MARCLVKHRDKFTFTFTIAYMQLLKANMVYNLYCIHKRDGSYMWNI